MAKDKEDKKAAKPDQPKESPQKPQMSEEEKKKRWKGKDWYAILAPELFSRVPIAETPATDPQLLVGRTVDVSVAEITGNPQKFHQKLVFMVDRVDGKQAFTRFAGYEILREQLFRIVRKRLEKIQIVSDVETNDGWKFQCTTIAIMNRNTEANISRKVRLGMSASLAAAARESSLKEFVEAVISGTLPMRLRKESTKIYPVRFCEIAKVDVVQMGKQE